MKLLEKKKKEKEEKGARIKERGRKSMNFKVSKFKARIKVPGNGAKI